MQIRAKDKNGRPLRPGDLVRAKFLSGEATIMRARGVATDPRGWRGIAFEIAEDDKGYPWLRNPNTGEYFPIQPHTILEKLPPAQEARYRLGDDRIRCESPDGDPGNCPMECLKYAGGCWAQANNE